MALLWWTAGSPLSRWTRRGASSGLSKGPYSAQLHFQAYGEQIKQALTEGLTTTHLLNAYFGQSIGDSPIMGTFLALYLVLRKTEMNTAEVCTPRELEV